MRLRRFVAIVWSELEPFKATNITIDVPICLSYNGKEIPEHPKEIIIAEGHCKNNARIILKLDSF